MYIIMMGKIEKARFIYDDVVMDIVTKLVYKV